MIKMKKISQIMSIFSICLFNSISLAGDVYSQYETTEIPEELNTIVGVMITFAMVVAVFKLVQIGFKALTGSGKGLQEAKSAMIPWLIGVIVCALFLAIGDSVIRALTVGLSGNIFG